MRVTLPATTWHIIETRGTVPDRHSHSYSVAAAAPRVLGAVTAPYLESHRIVEMRRQRVRADLSHVRLTLAPRGEAGSQITLAAMMIRGS